jgi:hypothetical protein
VTHETITLASQGGVQNCPFSLNASRFGPALGSFW